MKVNGKAFKQAREEVRKNSPRRGVAGQPARGTQLWLAGKAKVLRVDCDESADGKSKVWQSLGLRTIQALERGEASIETIDAVSEVLGINGRELILDYGQEYVKCAANGVVDFRPSIHPDIYPDNFHDMPLMVTVDPLTITFNPADFDSFKLEHISLVLSFPNFSKCFNWIYEVSLTAAASSWLGDEEGVIPFSVELEDGIKAVSKSIMFAAAEDEFLSWREFVTAIEDSPEHQLDIDIELKFSTFQKNIKILASMELLRMRFSKGREFRKAEWPYRVHIEPLSIKE